MAAMVVFSGPEEPEKMTMDILVSNVQHAHGNTELLLQYDLCFCNIINELHVGNAVTL